MKSTCSKGHPLSGENLYVSPKGVRHCRECGRDRHAVYRSTEKGRFAAKSRDLKAAGWTVERYLSARHSQKNRCAICQQPFDVLAKRPACDHNHETQEPRGLLCNDCNSGIGFLKENVSILETAIQYLNQWKGSYVRP